MTPQQAFPRSRPMRHVSRCLFALLLAGMQSASLRSQQAATTGKNPSPVQRTARFLAGRATLAHSAPARALAQARVTHQAMLAQPRAASLSAAWTAVGPGQIATAAYGEVTGRVTAIAVDPADATGNTVYVGTTGGGVWKSTNAAGPASNVSFVPLTDTLAVFNANAGTTALPSLSIGAIAISNGVLLAGTGDPNDASDSYYGSGLLRSADGGVTWTLIQESQDGVAGHHSLFGLAFAGFAFSSATPSLVVAAVSQAGEATLVNAVPDAYSVMGLYYSADAGVTWQLATVQDGTQSVQTPESVSGNAATAVVWNPIRQRFYAAIRYHGYYQSSDGMNWTRLAAQPGTGLTLAACPTNPGLPASVNCPLFRGALAVQASTGDTFALSVDAKNLDQGLWEDICGSPTSGAACASANVTWATRLASAPLEVGGGNTEIEQADYNMALAAVPSGTGTLLYVGTIDLYRCSLTGGCVLRNTTNAQNGCAAPAKVAPAQHAVATSGAALLYLGNDGGVWRSTDAVNESQPPCSADDANHFQNLNSGIGSLAEVVSFAQDPVSSATLMVGVGANGTAGTGTAGTSAWPQLAAGEGGTVAIDPTDPLLWYLSTAAGVSIGRCANGASCTAASFAGLATIGAAQTGYDESEYDAPWLLDPLLTADVLIGTCRAWRGLAGTGTAWSGANAISQPFGSTTATGCSSGSPVVRSLSAGGPLSNASAAENAGSSVLYAGLAGALDGGSKLGGHLFATKAAGTANSATVWTDTGTSPVSNDVADAGIFNPGGFDLSSVYADPHDATGATVYAAAMGFAGNGTNAPHLYRSVDFGAHWTNISSNLPDAPANSVLVDPNDANTVYLAMDTGVYVTTSVTTCSTANCWSVYGAGLPNSPVVQLLAATAMSTGDGRLGELRAATYGRGIWAIPLLTAVSPAAPALSLTPTSLTFALQQVGTQSPAQPVTATNTGNAAMTVSSVVASGDFNVSGSCIGTSIAPGATCTEQVVFLPSAAGARSGLLTVYANVPGGQATVSLHGTATPPASIVLDPVTLSFGTTSLGASSAAQNITVSNTGGVPATLQVPTITGDFHISANTCGSSLAASTGCTLSITFTPTASGVRNGTLTVVDSVGTQTASLTGTGSAPATDALAPLSLTFAAQLLNTTSPAQTVTLTNSGDAALTLIAAQIVSGDFSVVNGCGNSLNGHSSCSLLVTFAPKSVGTGSGVMIVADVFRSQTVTLNGTGLAPAGVSVSPASGIAFATTAVGSSSSSQTVTVTNNGGVALTLASNTVTGDFAMVPGSNTCAATIAPAAACSFGIAFTPSAGGPRSGSLTLTDSAASSPQTLALSGIGVDFSLAADGPTSLTIASGGSAAYALLLSSAASVPGIVTFTCAGIPANSTCAISPITPTLGKTTVIAVNIATTAAELTVPSIRQSTSPIWWTCLLPLGLVLARRRRLRGVVLSVFLSVAVGGLWGCGWGRLVPGTGSPVTTTTPTNPTPSGTSTIVVSASSDRLVRSVNLTLVVQ